MTFDPNVARFASAFIAALMLTLMSAYWLTRKTYRGFGWWLVSELVLLGALGMSALQSLIHQWPNAASDFLLIAGVIIGVEGSRRFFERAHSAWWVIGLGSIAYVIALSLRLAGAPGGSSTVNLYLGAAALGTGGYSFGAVPRGWRTPSRVFGGVFCTVGLFLIWRELARWFPAIDVVYPSIPGLKVTIFHIGNALTLALETAAAINVNAARLESELKEAIARSEEERRRADEANRAKSVFLANMSHELRTPLNGILGFAQIMDRDRSLGAEHRQHLATILRCGDTLLNLINEILSLSKIEAGRVTIENERFDLENLLRGLEEMLRVRADAKGLTLTVELDPGMPRRVVGDESRLRQVLTNLLGNAIKFTERGGVMLRASGADGRGIFEVSDTGAGIAAAELETLFEPFVQTESGRKSKEGTGLGLAISRNFARMMGGDITATSEAGRGSCFRLEISLPEAPADARISERDTRESRRVIGLAEGQHAWRILVADDLADNRTLLVELLGAVGFDVRAAKDGGEAVRVWREWRPHLIWMDKRMPGMGGIEATRIIRSEERDEHVVIIALSASALEHERGDILAAGCDDFLPKPFREEAVFAKMASTLGLTYVYESEAETKPAANLTDLSRLPPEWLDALRSALDSGNVQGMESLVAKIEPGHASIAAAIRTRIAAYRFEEIEQAITIANRSASSRIGD